MKKTVLLLLILCFLLSGTSTFASNSANAAADTSAAFKPVEKQNIRPGSAVRLQNAKNRVAEAKKQLSEARKLSEEIRSNSSVIAELQKEAGVAYKEAKNKVRVLMKNKDSLTGKQIVALKHAAGTLSSGKQRLDGTISDMKAENSKLAEAKISKNPGAYNQTLKGIVSIQKNRIDVLKAVINDLERLAVM